jgi:hypothetical protein
MVLPMRHISPPPPKVADAVVEAVAEVVDVEAPHRRRTVHELDRLAVSVASALCRTVRALARTAAVLTSIRGWQTFGHARVDDYATERLGRSGRWLRDQASLGRALDGSAALRQAVDGSDGRRPLGRSAAC